MYPSDTPKVGRSFRVGGAAARAALTASKRTCRPVDALDRLVDHPRGLVSTSSKNGEG